MIDYTYVNKKGSIVYQAISEKETLDFLKIDYIVNLYRLSPIQSSFWFENTFKIDLAGNKRI